jgi:hypothetical protein
MLWYCVSIINTYKIHSLPEFILMQINLIGNKKTYNKFLHIDLEKFHLESETYKISSVVSVPQIGHFSTFIYLGQDEFLSDGLYSHDGLVNNGKLQLIDKNVIIADKNPYILEYNREISTSKKKIRYSLLSLK